MPGQPKPAFYVAAGVVVVVLIGVAIWRLSPKPSPTPATTPDIVKGGGPGKKAEEGPGPGEPAIDLTEKTYEFVPQDKLIAVKGKSTYKPLAETKAVRFAINVWAGWGPIILANEGFKPGKVWKMPDGTEFKVELVLIDNPVAMRDAYANGEVHIGWGTLDMVPLMLQTMVNAKGQPNDADATKFMPRIYQQIDWSSGGDGIVVRDAINTTADLKGKKIVLAQNSPSHYFALNMLVAAGVQPRDVNFVFSKTAFEAAAAFDKEKDISACVSWSPDIYTLTKKKGNKMLVTTAQANKLIADIWFARADFARDYPGIIEGLVRGIFDAMEEMADKDEAQKKAAQLMADGYSVPLDAANDMLGDAHNTNWAENFQFFLNQNNPTNFEHVWKNAYALYSHPQIKVITHQPVPFDQVMDFSVIKKLGQESKYADQKDRGHAATASAPLPVPPEGTPEILGSRFDIRFYPNSADLHKTVLRKKDGKDVEEPYDPAVDDTLAKIAQLIETFGATRVVIEGHTDASMKSQVAAADLPALTAEVKKLSEERATAVKQALVDKFKVDPNRVTVRGMGWDKPADNADPNNQTKNRRVEVKIYPAEAGDK